MANLGLPAFVRHPRVSRTIPASTAGTTIIKDAGDADGQMFVMSGATYVMRRRRLSFIIASHVICLYTACF
jgi:hypothetical protein